MGKVWTFLKYTAVTLLVFALIVFIVERCQHNIREREQAFYNAVHGGDAALVAYCNEYFTISVFRECAANIEYLRGAAEITP